MKRTQRWPLERFSRSIEERRRRRRGHPVLRLRRLRGLAYVLPLTTCVESLKRRLGEFQRTRAGLLLKKVVDDQAPNLASQLAWGTLTALLPLLLGIVSLAGLILRDPERLDQIYSTIIAVLPSDAAGPVTSALDGIRNEPAGSVGLVALILLLFNGSAFFSNMASVFDQVYHVEGRNFVVERLLALALLIATTALLVVSTLAAGLSGLVGNVPMPLPVAPLLGRGIGWSISIVSVFLLFLLVYRFLPNVEQTWSDVLPGTALSSVLLLVVSQAFPLYTTYFPPNHAYALFGVFLVFTFWLYLVGFVFVLGAELNAFLRQEKFSAMQQPRGLTAKVSHERVPV